MQTTVIRSLGSSFILELKLNSTIICKVTTTKLSTDATEVQEEFASAVSTERDSGPPETAASGRET
jgi:hypothetical protein